MKKKDVKINGVYAVKVGRNVTGVRIMKENPHGGWDGMNLSTHKAVRIKSPARLRGPWQPRTTAKTPTPACTGTADRSVPVEKKKDKAGTSAKVGEKPTRAKRGNSGGKKTSGLDAAAQVLKNAKQSMRCKEIVQVMLDKGLWTTGGKTPHATIYSAILREIQTKGGQARFKKAQRGLFAINTTVTKGA